MGKLLTLSSLAQSTRFSAILEAIRQNGQVSVDALAAQLKVVPLTVRRDLRELEVAGRLRRVRGGAVANALEDPGFQVRRCSGQQAKVKIGRIAAAMIEPEQTIYIDSGSTADTFATALADRCHSENIPVHVVTHALNIASRLSEQPGVTLTIIGGDVTPTTLSTGGAPALHQIEPLHFDLFLMSATGVDLEAGWTNANSNSVALKQAVLDRADATWCIVDLKKWRIKSFRRICPFGRVSGWVLDQFPDETLRKTIANAGLQVRSPLQ